MKLSISVRHYVLQFFGFALFAVLLASCVSTAPTGQAGGAAEAICQEKRAAWDFGSGTVKVKAAVVNICEMKILEVLLEETQKINFKDDITKSKDRRFSEASVKSARLFVVKVQAKLKNLGVEKSQGFATSAFRDASNANEVITILNRDYKINLTVISQKDEGIWGYRAAQTRVSRSPFPMVVWDIGGGSQQIVLPDGPGVNVIESPWASVSFKNWILKNVKKSAATVTPNPLSKQEAEVAMAKAKQVGEELLPQLLTASGEKVKGMTGEVYGIGGVHSVSLVNQTKKMSFTVDDLEKALDRVVGKTDEQLKSAYAATDVSNLIFVSGIMQGLGFSKVHSLKVNLADGLLVHGVYP